MLACPSLDQPVFAASLAAYGNFARNQSAQKLTAERLVFSQKAGNKPGQYAQQGVQRPLVTRPDRARMMPSKKNARERTR
jgi:hypothetical protein